MERLGISASLISPRTAPRLDQCYLESNRRRGLDRVQFSTNERLDAFVDSPVFREDYRRLPKMIDRDNCGRPLNHGDPAVSRNRVTHGAAR